MRPHFFVIVWSFLFVSAHSVHADSLTVEGELIYDKAQKIYWTKNANLGGKMTWVEVQRWIIELNESNYGGYSDWRLPFTPDGTWGYDSGNGGKYNVTVSELGHLYYITLGLKGKKSPSGELNDDYGLGNKETPFDNLRSDLYWFGTISNRPDEQMVWIFDFAYGTHFLQSLNGDPAYAVAVRSAFPVPEPSSAALFLTGLFSLFRVRSCSNN